MGRIGHAGKGDQAPEEEAAGYEVAATRQAHDVAPATTRQRRSGYNLQAGRHYVALTLEVDPGYATLRWTHGYNATYNSCLSLRSVL